MDLEVIIGTIVRFSRGKGVDTPRLDLVLSALKPNQVQAIRTARQKDGGKGEAEVEGVTKYSDLVATSRGNWPAGAPVSSSPSTYL